MNVIVAIDALAPIPGWPGSPADELSAAQQSELADPERLDRFRAFARSDAASAFERVSLIGDGPAVDRTGPLWVSAAVDGPFERVRLYTGTRRWVERGAVEALARAGVDEIGLGVHGADAATHDAITSPGDFERIHAIAARATAAGCDVHGHCAVAVGNLAALTSIVELAVELSLSTLEFHTVPYFSPSSGPVIAGWAAVHAPLGAAVARGRALGLVTRIAGAPLCMLPEPRSGSVEGRPVAAFEGMGRDWVDRAEHTSCLFAGRCGLARRCGGLEHRYVETHGWEQGALRPVPLTEPWRARDRAIPPAPGRLDRARARGHARWLALLGEFEDLASEVGLERAEARYRLSFTGGPSLTLRLEPRDDERPAYARTRSFNLSYVEVQGDVSERTIDERLRPVADAIAARDEGTLSLDAKST